MVVHIRAGMNLPIVCFLQEPEADFSCVQWVAGMTMQLALDAFKTFAHIHQTD